MNESKQKMEPCTGHILYLFIHNLTILDLKKQGIKLLFYLACCTGGNGRLNFFYYWQLIVKSVKKALLCCEACSGEVEIFGWHDKG